jgi:hypothetical protein
MPVDVPMIGRAISSGLNLPFFPATITRLAGVDPSAELLSMGRPKLNGVSFPVELISRSAEILPFDDRSFDTVVVTWPTSGVSFSVGSTHVVQLGTSNISSGIYFGGKS